MRNKAPILVKQFSLENSTLLQKICCGSSHKKPFSIFFNFGDNQSQKLWDFYPLSLLFNVGCKSVCSFLATTAWHSFFRLDTTLNQGVGGIVSIFEQVKQILGPFHETIVSLNNFIGWFYLEKRLFLPKHGHNYFKKILLPNFNVVILVPFYTFSSLEKVESL